MLNEDQIADLWLVFKDCLDKKQVEVAAEKFIDFLADYGVSDETLREVIGTDAELEEAITYYLDDDGVDDDDDYNEWDD